MTTEKERIAVLLSEWQIIKSSYEHLRERMENLVEVMWNRFMNSYQSYLRLQVRFTLTEPGRTVSQKAVSTIDEITQIYPLALSLARELQELGTEMAQFDEHINFQKEEIDKIAATSEGDQDANE